MTLLQKSEQSEARILGGIGLVVVLLVAVAIALNFALHPFSPKTRGLISLVIQAPYVGQGVAPGTPVILHGVKIGEVGSVSSIAGGGVRLQTDLQARFSRGLTDTLAIDYQPSNYFGVTGVNVIPAPGGHPLRSGMQINLRPAGNFTLQALIYRFGELSNGVFDQRLIRVIDRATRYADGLTPLLETALTVATSVAKVQTVRTEQLLRNATGVSVAFPGFVDSLIGTGNDLLHSADVDFDIESYKKMYKYWPVLGEDWRKRIDDNNNLERSTLATDEYFDKHFDVLYDKARTDFLSVLGKLESSHINDLLPVIDSVKAIVDTFPKIVSPNNFAYTLTEIRKRFERMYAGSGDERALQVRIILDRLPAVATPLGVGAGGPP
jgi:phospholipid/cholesterol/gamma-HCH transport system substrate-binding protein